MHTNDSGEMHISQHAWLLAAIAVPLTIATIAIWWTWVYFNVVPKAPTKHQIVQQAKVPSRLFPWRGLLSRAQICEFDLENQARCSSSAPTGKTRSFSFSAKSFYESRWALGVLGNLGTGKSG